MSHLIKIFAVCKFSYFRLWYLKSTVYGIQKLIVSASKIVFPNSSRSNLVEQFNELIWFCHENSHPHRIDQACFICSTFYWPCICDSHLFAYWHVLGTIKTIISPEVASFS